MGFFSSLSKVVALFILGETILLDLGVSTLLFFGVSDSFFLRVSSLFFLEESNLFFFGVSNLFFLGVSDLFDLGVSSLYSFFNLSFEACLSSSLFSSGSIFSTPPALILLAIDYLIRSSSLSD